MSVNDTGSEVLRKSAVEVTPGDPSEYKLRVDASVSLGDITIDPAGLATEAKQDDQIDLLTDIKANQTNGTSHVIVDDMPPVTVDTSLLATAALQTTANTKLDTLHTDLAAIDGHVDGLEGLIGTTNTTLSTINTTLGTIDTHVDSLEGFTDGIEGKLDAINTNLDTLHADFGTLGGFVDGLEGFTDGLEALIGTTNTTLSSISGFVDGLEGFTDGLETLIASTNTKLDTLHGDVDDLETLITSTNTKLDTINTSLSSVAVKDTTASAVLTITGDSVQVDCTGLSTLTAQFVNFVTAGDTVAFTASLDGTNYEAVVASNIDYINGYAAQIPIQAVGGSTPGIEVGGFFKFSVAGFKYVKFTAAFGGGGPKSVTVLLRGNLGTNVIESIHDQVFVRGGPVSLDAGSALVGNFGLSQNSTTSGQSGPLVQSATTTNAPSYTTAKTNPLSSDTAGNIRVSLKDSTMPTLAAGTALIGKVGIDQTTPGTTNGVQVNAALPAGANAIGKLAANSGVDIGDVDVTSLPSLIAGSAIIGKVGIDQTTPGTTNKVAIGTDGTVTANAGTNLNTSLLAVESGGNLAGSATSLAIMDDWDESDRAKVNPIVGQAGVQGGSGAVSATTQRVVLATDVALPAGTAIIGALSSNQSVNCAQVSGNAISTGNGTVGTGVQRVAIASDNTAFAVNATLQAGTNGIGKLTANSGVNIGDVNIVDTRTAYFYEIPSQVHVASANTIHWDMFNADAALLVRVLGIYQLPNINTAVTGIAFDWSIFRTSAVGTGGSAVSAWLPDLSQTALDADITLRTKPSGGATTSGNAIRNYTISSEETNAATQLWHSLAAGSMLNLVPSPVQWQGGILLRQNQGLKCVQVTNSNAGNTGWIIAFTVA